MKTNLVGEVTFLTKDGTREEKPWQPSPLSSLIKSKNVNKHSVLLVCLQGRGCSPQVLHTLVQQRIPCQIFNFISCFIVCFQEQIEQFHVVQTHLT